MSLVQIKICGITREEEAGWLNEAKVDYAGFVLFEKSKRNITITKTQKIFEKLNPNIKKVAVTVSPDPAKIRDIEKAGFDIIQIHGEVEPELLKESRLPVWRAVNLKEMEDLKKLITSDLLESGIQAVLVDAGDYGSGKTFGWENQPEADFDWQEKFRILRQRLKDKNILFILAGGLHPGNVAEGIRLFGPDAVDVSSGVEPDTDLFSGKSREKINAFVQAARCEKNGVSLRHCAIGRSV